MKKKTLTGLLALCRPGRRWGWAQREQTFTGSLSTPNQWLASSVEGETQGQCPAATVTRQAGWGCGWELSCPHLLRALSALARCQEGLLMALRIYCQGHMQRQCQGHFGGILNTIMSSNLRLLIEVKHLLVVLMLPGGPLLAPSYQATTPGVGEACPEVAVSPGHILQGLTSHPCHLMGHTGCTGQPVSTAH